MDLWLGIDFGTSFSSAAIMLGVEPQLINNFPSSVFITDIGKLIVGKEAENLCGKNPVCYRTEFKRDLGTKYPYQFGTHRFLPETLITEVIKSLKQQAEKKFKTKFANVVLTVPASHQEHKRRIMVKAAKEAGFREVHLLEEPIAAAIYYARHSTIKDGEILLIYDFGGGTFDVSLIQKQGSDYEILEVPRGLERCGGVDFDKAIFQNFKERCSPQARAMLEKQDASALNSRLTIRDFCRDIKHELSQKKIVKKPSPLDFRPYELTREAFNGMVSSYIEQTVNECSELVAATELSLDKISRILLVGGSSRIPLVQQTLEQEFKRPIYMFEEPELAVCKGAAVYEEWIKGHSYFKKGIKQTEKGDYQRAIESFSQALRENPKYSNALVKRGAVYGEIGNTNLSFQDFTEALKINPYNAAAYQERANVLNIFGNYQEAIENADKALYLDAKYIAAYDIRGRVYFDLGDIENSNKDWDSVVNVKNNNTDSLVTRGFVYYFRQNYKKAYDEFDQAVQSQNNYAAAYVGRAIARFKLSKDLYGAFDDFDEALKHNPNLSHTYGWRGNVLSDSGDFKKAHLDYNKAIDINPNYMMALNNRGHTHLNLGNFNEAKEDFDKVLTLNSNYKDAYVGKGLVYLNLGEYDSAMDNFNLALQIDPRFAWAYQLRSQVFYFQDQPEKALADLEHAKNLPMRLGEEEGLPKIISDGTDIVNIYKYIRKICIFLNLVNKDEFSIFVEIPQSFLIEDSNGRRLVEKIEEEFSIFIPSQNARNFRNVEELILYIHENR